MVEYLPLSQIAPDRIETLLDAAFGVDRHGRTAYRVRGGVAAIDALSFAAVDGAVLLGTVQSWPVALADDAGRIIAPLIMVGPVAVEPALQRGGIGRALMRTQIAAAEQHADAALMMIGDPEYYGRFFDFTADATGAWQLPGPVEPRRLLARPVAGHAVPAQAGHVIARSA